MTTVQTLSPLPAVPVLDPPTASRMPGADHPNCPAMTPAQHLNNRLYTVATRGRDDAVLQAIMDGADIHDRDNNALRSAAGAGRPATVRLLLEHGADLTAREHHALRMGARGGHAEVVLVLLDSGADLTACDYDAIVLAVAEGRASALAVLLNHAVTQGIPLPLEVLERAHASIPAGSRPRHDQALDVLMPHLRQARIEHERQVLNDVIAEVDRTLLPGDGRDAGHGPALSMVSATGKQPVQVLPGRPARRL